MSEVLDEEAKRAALGAVFQVVAALHATHADPATAGSALRTTFAPDVDLGKLDTSPAAIAAGGAESEDEHDVKLAAAVLREHACAPQDELLAAGAVRLRGREGRGRA
ncbi:hypothetical protein [Chondromyces apiculatus]|uniref:Uncharacterized protein n=1 Tax=Chondromyces apiculatus DSM 436 TaxID=1192034 RepID=A0A017TCI8_9BACT|nr:hypothetical protein [Chondromyces apiculatus]EYF06964.1 Hypothetical protein CAP_1223 [Chondromyces apiculatus DSM 436]